MSLDAEDDTTLRYIGEFINYKASTEKLLKSFEVGLYPTYKKYGFTFQQAFAAYLAEQHNQWLKDVVEVNNDSDNDWKEN